MMPSHCWQSARLKFVAPLRNERTPAGADHAEYVGLENIESWTGRMIASEPKADKDSEAETGLANVFREGDVLFGKLRPYLAKACQAPRDGVCSTELLVMQPAEALNPRFLLYELLTPDFVGAVDASTFGARMPRASWDFIGSLEIRLPPLETQSIIANYLDRETARIDRLIAAKERMLALLEEKRAALISRVVTRGLDPNVPLKPSGQEWLGEIPAHWQVQPIKYLAVVGNGSTPSVDNADYWDDQGYPWLNSSVVNVSPVTVASRFVTETALRECHLPKIQPPAVLVGITGQGKTRGMAAVLGVEATINQHLAFIKPRTQALCADYLCHLLGHAYAFLRSDSDGAGSTKGAITCEQLANMKIPVPPRCEQIEICARIGQSLAVSMPVRSKIQASLDLLTERRAALITAAVTGQIPPEEMGA
ncbi:MAG: restriction endonuclease subunit S [Thauera aminoaromatica]|jgi:type I restriction enzyme S subunit|uniref:Restriction endonuclease subunit S n=3 Tax=Thauera aminoaromatica TaxID=164330 RepID=A0A5C7SUW0_THASP|nr:MAG: restriction endonuclease subunit S [Thauera aminoaromatica]